MVLGLLVVILLLYFLCVFLAFPCLGVLISFVDLVSE